MTAALSTPNVQVSEQSIGSLHGRLVKVTFAGSDYVSNGIDLSTRVNSGDVIGAVVLSLTGALQFTSIAVFDPVTKKLILQKGTAGANAEVANGAGEAGTVTLLILTA
jgi:hypothetical protein